MLPIAHQIDCLALQIMLLRTILILLYLFETAVSTKEKEHEIEQDNGVFVLNEENFISFLQQHPTSLIKFYAPW